MSQTEPKDGSQEQPGAADSDVARLRAEVNALKQKMESENRGFLGWTKRWAGPLAFAAAIFAVPRGGIELYNSVKQLLKHPETRLSSSELAWSFDPQQRLLVLRFPLTLVNVGNEEDIVVDAGARLAAAAGHAGALEDYYFEDFKCAETGEPRPLPRLLHVAAKSQVEMRCTLTSSLTQQSAGAFLGSGPLRLAVALRGEDKRENGLKLCFNPSGKAEGTYADPQCFEGEN